MHQMHSWIAGLSLIAITIAIHAVGLVRIELAMRTLLDRGSLNGGDLSPRPWLATAMVGGIGAALGVLHGIEVAIWAWAYLLIGAIDTMPAAILYSIDSMTTRGDSGLRLADPWLLMGALEAAGGMLLFGISTAFLFGMSARIWSILPAGSEVRSPGG